MSLKPIKTYFKYQLPIPDLGDDAAVLNYAAAWEEWKADRLDDGAHDRITVAEQSHEHQLVMARAAELATL